MNPYRECVHEWRFGRHVGYACSDFRTTNLLFARSCVKCGAEGAPACKPKGGA